MITAYFKIPIKSVVKKQKGKIYTTDYVIAFNGNILKEVTRSNPKATILLILLQYPGHFEGYNCKSFHTANYIQCTECLPFTTLTSLP